MLAFTGFFWWAIGKQLPKISQLDVIKSNKAPILSAANKTIKVASYNIGHGQGLRGNLSNYLDKKVMQGQLDEVAWAINYMNPDIIMLQEVDIKSGRTHGVNQFEYIRKNTSFSYFACALVWNKNYIPFPTMNIKNHIGFAQVANCILSKYPLKNHERLIFEKPASYPWWLKLAYIDRGLQRVDIEIGERKIALINVHLEAWDILARQKQIMELAAYTKNIKLPIILGGDFNTLLPNTKKLKGFTDEPEADFSHDHSLKLLFEKEPDLSVPELILENMHAPYEQFTYPSNFPDRRLDHIFSRGPELLMENFRVVFEAKTASDHLPIMVELKIN